MSGETCHNLSQTHLDFPDLETRHSRERLCNQTASRSSPRRRSRPPSGSLTSAATRRRCPSTCSRSCSSRTAASSCPSCASSASTRRPFARPNTQALDALPKIQGSATAEPAGGSSELVQILRAAETEMRELNDEYVSTEHLLLAIAQHPGKAGDALRSSRRDARAAAQGAGRGPRQPSRHRREPRGQVPRARALRPRPDRGRRAGQARPGDRPRRRDPPRGPGPVEAHQEQPGADRRARRRQDRDRRGPRPADRVRRRAREPQGSPPGRARPERDGRRIEVPRRVRGPAQGRAQGDRRRQGPDHRVHRRAPHDRRRRRRRGRDGRRQHAQADARPRRAAGGRRDHARRVPQAHREGPRARAPLPARVRGRADRRRTRSRSSAASRSATRSTTRSASRTPRWWRRRR